MKLFSNHKASMKEGHTKKTTTMASLITLKFFCELYQTVKLEADTKYCVEVEGKMHATDRL